MVQLLNYLVNLRGDVFKLLPMKESELNGVDNHLNDYIESLIVNMAGGMKTYPEIADHKNYLYVINNLHYLLNNEVPLKKWRKIVLNSTGFIDTLYVSYGGEKDGK